jgi:hypothetical protein
MPLAEDDLINVQIFLSVMAELKIEVLVFQEPESVTKHVYFRGDFDHATHRYISSALGKLKHQLVCYLQSRLEPVRDTNFHSLLETLKTPR